MDDEDQPMSVRAARARWESSTSLGGGGGGGARNLNQQTSPSPPIAAGTPRTTAQQTNSYFSQPVRASPTTTPLSPPTNTTGGGRNHHKVGSRTPTLSQGGSTRPFPSLSSLNSVETDATRSSVSNDSSPSSFSSPESPQLSRDYGQHLKPNTARLYHGNGRPNNTSPSIENENIRHSPRQTPGQPEVPTTVIQHKHFDPLKASPALSTDSNKGVNPLDSNTETIRIDDASDGTSESLGRKQSKSLLGSLKKGAERFRKKTDFVEIVSDGRDTVMTVGQNFGVHKSQGGLCSGCSKIPFDDCVPLPRGAAKARSEGNEATFYMPIEKILTQRSWCQFCKLLFQSVCQPQNDLLQRPPQVRMFLQDRLKHKSFEQWATETPEWKRMVEGVGNKFGLVDDNWPFGSSRDQRETAEAAAQALRNYQDEEGGIDDGQTGLEDVLRDDRGADPILGAAWAGTVALGVGKEVVADKENVGQEAKHIINAAEMATNQLAIFSAITSRPMTCWFLVRAFRRGHPRAGEFTVRVFGHGRAPRAPLSQLCRFKLRFERSSEIRNDATGNGQIWYAQRLRPLIDLPFFGECLARCEKLHGRACNETKSAVSVTYSMKEQSKPFRVIDVKNWQIAEFGLERPEYIALSFCWGKGTDRHCELRVHNKAKLLKHQGLQGESLPQTFQDAMTVVKNIGAQYLWIDRLCIVQDDSKEGGDKEHQIAQMDRIYGEALFTIVAADGRTADAGLAGVSRSREFKQIIEDVKPTVHMFLPLEIKQQLLPWESRAWTFQEKILSRRLLIFTNGFAIWHCRKAVWREDVNALDGASQDISLRWLSLERQGPSEASVVKLEEDASARIFRPLAFSEYAEAVNQYSSRTMTFSSDILPAFQGLQRTFEAGALGKLFRYGIPERFIDLALLWQPDVRIERRENEKDGKQLPSWSWAGWNGTRTAAHSLDDGHGIQGAKVSYQKPFDVCTDDDGALVQRLGSAQDERIRPMLRWFAIPISVEKVTTPTPSPSLPAQSPPLTPGNTSAQLKRPPPRPPSKSHLHSSSSSSLPLSAHMSGTTSTQGLDLVEVESFRRQTGQRASAPTLPSNLLSKLSDRHLVFETQGATLLVGPSCRRRAKSWKKLGTPFVQELLETAADGDERLILDSSQQPIGIIRLHGGPQPKPSNRIETIVLSAAQFIGTEQKVDVFGYPLYNIMAIRRDEAGIAERIGLGKVYKYAWDLAKPATTMVVLG